LRSLLPLLLFLLCACDYASAPDAVMRFYVYSDTQLASVRATVIGGDAGTSNEIKVDGKIANDELLFFIAVERTAESKFQERAVVRFEATPHATANAQNVVSQTVSAAFTNNETSYVRIRLSAACAQATIDECGCEGSSNECVVPAPAKFDPERDLQRWREVKTNVCTSCPAEQCSGDGCLMTQIVPPIEEIDADSAPGTTELPLIYMRRVLAGGSRIAIGVNSSAPGSRFKVFVASDAKRLPGTLLAVGEGTVAQAPSLQDGLRRGLEIPLPQVALLVNTFYWIGAQLLSGSGTVDAVDFLRSVEDQTSTADSLPELGQALDVSSLAPLGPDAIRPHIYAVFDP
jgi:rRNA maturation protein Nop10